jgi:hypothetical protein
MSHTPRRPRRRSDPASRVIRGKQAAFIGLLLLLLCTPAAVLHEVEASPLNAGQFVQLMQSLSEESGYFWNDNYVSNEASYLHPLKKLRELGIQGGIYLGVGPNQNFTYIAKLKPRYAFIIDIRRQNLLEHLIFKALFHFASDRREYLSLLLSRPLEADALSEDCTIDELVRYFQAKAPDSRLYHQTEARIRSYLTDCFPLNLTPQDLINIDKVHRAFFLRGVSIKYDFIPVPTYAEFLLERDLEGKQQNFLNSASDFRYLKRMQEENRIIPVVGDFAGPHALITLGKYLREHNEKVMVFYTSNVEQYLMRNSSWGRFMNNLRELPLDEKAVFIRTYWSNYIQHPEELAGYKFTQTLQWVVPFVKTYDPRAPYSYWDLVTRDTIKLK